MAAPDLELKQQRRSISIFLFWKWFTLRHVREEWFQTLLLMLILGLGVGTFLSIRMANRAAVEGFRLFTDSLNGTSDWIIESRGEGLPVSELPLIRKAFGATPASLIPVIEMSAFPLDLDQSSKAGSPPTLRLLGLDLVQLRALTSTSEDADLDEFWSMLRNPNHLLVSKSVAELCDLSLGSRLEIAIRGKREWFEIKSILPEFNGKTPLPKNLVVVDLPALLDRLNLDTVDRIEVVIPDGAMREQNIEAVHSGFKQAFGDKWQISSPQDKTMEGASMTAAFRLNLTVLSLIALLVGLFLIAQTLDATVSRRRREIATLRSLGIGPREIYRLWLSEALLYGLAAGFLGILVGYGLTHFTVEAVTTTVRSLYRETSQTAASIALSDVALSFGLGISGSLLAAWLPARDAASTPPAQFLRLGKRIPPFPIFEHPGIGAGMLLMGAFLAFVPPWHTQAGSTIPVAGYATAFLWLMGGTLTAASALKGVGRLIHRLGRNHAPMLLAGSRLSQPTSRHQLALAGFFVAIGMASSMAFLINSFEHTVTQWLGHRLRADLFISSTGFQGADSGPRMDGSLLDQIESFPGIRAVDRFRSQEVRVNGIRFSLAGSRFDLLGTDQDLLWLKGPLPKTGQPAGADAIGYANENLMMRTGLKLDDSIQILTPSGTKTIWIGGIHADYARDNGLLLIDLPLLENWYRIDDYETASVFLEEGAPIDTIKARLQESYPGLTIRQNRELMETALFIFHQTFAVTRALQVIGLVVALAGLVLSLLSLLRESGKELSLQRTLGMNRHEIAITTAIEGTGVAFTGMVSGFLLSGMLGTILIFVINKQSFGWTLQAAYPWIDGALLSTSVMLLGLSISYATGRLYLRRWKQEAL